MQIKILTEKMDKVKRYPGHKTTYGHSSGGSSKYILSHTVSLFNKEND